MTEPIADFIPEADQSPVVALLSNYGGWIRSLFFAALISAPLAALAGLAGFGVIPIGVAAGFVALAALGGQMGMAVGIAWALESALLFMFMPGLAVIYALLGVWLWVRDVPPERTALAMAMPVAAPFGLAPALILTASAIEGLMGIVTVAWGAAMTILVAIALGKQTLGAFAETGFVLEQPTLFDPQRAAETNAALGNLLLSASDRTGPLATVFDPETLWSQLAALVSRLVGADVASVATVLAWTIAALVVWGGTRLMRMFFDALLRGPSKWFSLFVLAQAISVTAGASMLFLLFVTWGPLARAAGRPAEGVLLVSAFVGAVLATAASIVISATQKTEVADEGGPHVSLGGRRIAVR